MGFLMKAGIFVAVIVFSFLVWPTPYRYTKSEGKPVRINRFTGNVEKLTDIGWKALRRMTKRESLQFIKEIARICAEIPKRNESDGDNFSYEECIQIGRKNYYKAGGTDKLN